MPAGASEDFLFCAVEIDSLLFLLLFYLLPENLYVKQSWWLADVDQSALALDRKNDVWNVELEEL